MKVSIVVPVYKVEMYLDRCIASLTYQTYSDIEIILIDDGSSDNCGKICDSWASRDERIRVIHKENGGVSSARNVGIDSATGTYIMFVDSDDYISDDYVYKMVKACKETGAEIAICQAERVYDDGKVIGRCESVLCPAGVYDKPEYVIKHSYFAPWGKIYRRDLFDGIRFKHGMQYEDFACMPLVMSKASKINVIDDVLYFYVYNSESIIVSHQNKKKVNPDIFRAMNVLIDSELKEKPEIVETLYVRYILSSAAWLKAEYNDKDCKSIEEMVNEGLEHFPDMKNNKYIHLAGKSHAVFVRLILRKHFFLAKVYVKLVSWAKMLYRQVRKICR